MAMKRMTRFLAGILTVVLPFTSALEALALQGDSTETNENQIVQGETEVDLLDFFKTTTEDLSNPEYILVEHEYVKGDEIRYYVSYLEEIDGFKRTEKTRSVQGWIIVNSVDEYPFEGDYVHLYYEDDGLMVPIRSNELTVKMNGREFQRTKFITSINEDVMKLLHETDTFRVTDNIYFLDVCVENKLLQGSIGLVVLKPKIVDDENLIVEYSVVTDMNSPYNDDLNGYLLYQKHSIIGTGYYSATEEQKTLTLERKKQ